MIEVRRAGQRYEITTTPGVTTRACFSSGPHYDPGNVRFGPLLACDDHEVTPGAGFAAHPHRGVELVTFVLAGVLAHEDGAGRRTDVPAGRLQRQLAGSRVVHAEGNASDVEALRFVQVWLEHGEVDTAYEVGTAPLALAAVMADVLYGGTAKLVAPYAHLYVAAGEYAVDGVALHAGDSLRAYDEKITVSGEGTLLVISVEA